jgi:hypothetical protein
MATFVCTCADGVSITIPGLGMKDNELQYVMELVQEQRAHVVALPKVAGKRKPKRK